MHYLCVTEADRNVSVVNDFGFENTADQKTSQPKPWPIPAAHVEIR